MKTTLAPQTIEDPPLARALFGDVRWSWIWLILRVYVGWSWLSEGIDKATTPAWIGANAGSFLTVWITKALLKTQGAHPDVQGWYGWFLSAIVLPHAALWSYIVTFGEIGVGIALILGLFTGIAAFFGTTMNASYLLAGTVSTNPILFAFGSLLVLAWKTAGWWGLDRVVLRRVITDGTGTVTAEAVAACPFSVAQDYTVDYLRRAQAGEAEAEIHVPLRGWPALLARRVQVTFGLHFDVLENGRAHDEIRVRWNAGAAFLPDFRGTIRFRIAGTSTAVTVEGTYRIPLGVFGRAFDAVLGRRIAHASVNDLTARIAAALEASQRDWRARVA
jgi:thiosulfate dehydrogenase [quinone] large subunit